MNENDPTNVPPTIGAIDQKNLPPMTPQRLRPFAWWLQKLFVCNPFYLVSAALLLYGCYRVSIDAPIFNLETARLLFNYTAVQFYEIILVVTAIFLARRRIWYDSTLLVGLENLLVFVPFILISQAALIDSNMALEMCLAGAVVAMIRFGGLKIKFHELNLPGRLLGVGAILLGLNVTLPLIYRHFGETKIGVHIDSGPAYWMNEYTWLLVLPAALGLVHFLPRARAAGALPPQHRWLPTGLFTLWIIVTSVHLYGLDYIYQFDLRGELLAPTAGILAWTIFLRLPASPAWLKYTLTGLPLLAPLLSTSPGGRKTFLILAALNLAAYAIASLHDRTNRMARHLMIASALLFIAGLPGSWLPTITPSSPTATSLAQLQYIAGTLMAYLVFWAVRLRHPLLTIFCSMILGAGIMTVFHNHPGAGHWAMQGGFIFLLLHSLRWHDQENPGANLIRMLTALAWVSESFIWMNSEAGRFWMPFIPGTLVFGACLACRLDRCEWKKAAVPIAALLVMLSGPGSALIEGLRSAPIGLLAFIGSFLLLGCGTLAALTRPHWQRRESQATPTVDENQSGLNH